MKNLQTDDRSQSVNIHEYQLESLNFMRAIPSPFSIYSTCNASVIQSFKENG